MPTTSYPASARSAAVTEESTPPDIATTTRVSDGRPSMSRLFSIAVPFGRRCRLGAANLTAGTIGAEACIRYVGDVRFLPAAPGKTCLPGPRTALHPTRRAHLTY